MSRLILALVISLAASVVIIASGAMAGGNGCIHDPVAGTFCGGPPLDTSERPK